MRRELHEQKYISAHGTPNHVRRHDIKEANNNNQHYSNNASSLSPPSPPSIARQTTKIEEPTTTTNLHEISSKAKWSTRKKILVGVLVSSLLGTLIIVSTVLGVILTRSKTETTTTPATTAFSIIVSSASWSFDNTTAELYGVYNGQLVNGATYTTVASNQPYVGYGRALSLISSSSQFFLVPTPFLNLSYTSFTVEAWIYPASITSDYGIFGQCQCSTCANQCLYLIVRANHLSVGFTLNDLTGSLTLIANTWHHVAFVYNYQIQQQILYLNGVQDTTKSNAQPYQGTNGTIQIGSTQVYLTTNYFSGYIDNLQVVTRAKSATEILSDASLVAYYSFDLPSPNLDNGPNGLNGTLVNTATVTGRVNEAMRFTGSSSYFYAYGFYQMPYSVLPTKSFSISLWINPSITTGCTFVQVSTSPSSGSCINLLGIWSTTGTGSGQITAQGYAWPTIFGPYVTANIWTHVSWTYSSTNGYSLYINGVLFGSTGTASSSNSGSITWLQIGYHLSGSGSYLANTAYQGSIDEIYVHNRELTASEVRALANP